MSPDAQSRAEREMEELRQLFAAPVRRAARTDEAEPTTSRAEDEKTSPDQPQPRSRPPGAAASPAEPAAAAASGTDGAVVREDTLSQSVHKPSGAVSARAMGARPDPETAAVIAAEELAQSADEPADQPTEEPTRPAERDVAQPAPVGTVPAPIPVAAVRDARRPRGRLGVTVLMALAVVGALALGVVLGGVLAPDRDAGRVPRAETAPSPARTPAVAPASAPATVPRACIEAARLADRAIDLLVANKRGRELDPILRAYGTASQQCRTAGATP